MDRQQNQNAPETERTFSDPASASADKTGDVPTGKKRRGFAGMDRAKVREIASKGGKAAHAAGKAHRWTSDQAREAGKKGAIASHRMRNTNDPEGAT